MVERRHGPGVFRGSSERPDSNPTIVPGGSRLIWGIGGLDGAPVEAVLGSPGCESATKWDPGRFRHTELIFRGKSDQGWGPDRQPIGTPPRH
jgi:hypothetical protein